MIAVTARDRRALRLPWSALIANKWSEFATKARGRRIKGQGMIGAEAGAVAAGFAALRGADFNHYNLPQAWVERRQIPTAINARIPARGAVVVDLGCGPGTSTAVLSRFADPSWRLFGFDLTPGYIAAARSREFRNREGEPISPVFTCQDISRPLLVGGEPMEAASVDFAISGGVVGLYLRRDAVTRLAAELARVVKPGGFAALDAGPACPVRALREIVEDAGFVYVERAKSFWIEPRPKLVFKKM